MAEVDLILTALMTGAAAGSTAGVTAAAQSAVLDAYTGLRDLLRRALTRQGRSAAVLDAIHAELDTWQTQLGEALVSARVDQDAQVLAAAKTLLAAADPAGTYYVDASNASRAQIGNHSMHIGTNYGATAGTMAGQVSISYGHALDPPALPGA